MCYPTSIYLKENSMLSPEIQTAPISTVDKPHCLSQPRNRIVLATIATLLWGSAFPMVKLGYASIAIAHNDTFKQLLYAGYRFTLAGIFLLFLSTVIYPTTWIFNRDKLVRVVRVGSVQTFLQYIFFYIGLALASGISGAIVASSVTFFQLLIAHLLFTDDKLSRRRLISALIGFCGIGFYHVMEHGWRLGMGMGEGLMLVAMLSGAYGNILSKRNVHKTLPVLTLTAWQMFAGGLGLVIVGASQAGWMPFQWNIYSSAILIYLALLSAMAFLLWNLLMVHNQVGKISVFLFLIPNFGVCLSALILGEPLHWYIAPALAMIMIGIFMANTSARR